MYGEKAKEEENEAGSLAGSFLPSFSGRKLSA